MKIIAHAKSVKPESMELPSSPLVVWLSREVELRVEKDDTLGHVVAGLRSHLSMSSEEIAKLVAFWFAIGERRHTRKLGTEWTSAELRTTSSRRYLHAR